MAVLTHIDRVPFGAPTPEEIAHDKIAKQLALGEGQHE